MSKKVFISYSWDSQIHKDWVASLANTLRADYGVEAIIDDFLVTSNLNKLMVQGISQNDKVVVVVTQSYTKKANEFSGGVGYETELLLNYLKTNPNKIIIVLRETCDKPFYLQGFYHIDFTNDTRMADSINELVLRIEDQPNYEVEEVNTVNPKKATPKKSNKFSTSTSDADLVDAIEEILSLTKHSFSPTGRIKCATWIKEFGFDIVAESARIAIKQYLITNKNGTYPKESINNVFNKIGGICKNKYDEKTKPYIAGTKQVLNYCKRKFRVNYYNENDLNAVLGILLYHYYKVGVYDEKLEDIMQYARTSCRLNDYIDLLFDMKKNAGI